MSAIISGNYVTFKHIKTRKVVVLEVEVAEEYFQEVITKLGMPIGGESKAVAVALLTEQKESGRIRSNQVGTEEQTEGEKLRTRAVMLCKTQLFWHYVGVSYGNEEKETRESICNYCSISSRSELATNLGAQNKFKELLEKYKNWQFENNYSDNLTRY